MIREFFAAVPGSTKGFLNAAALYRSILTALGSGVVVHVALAVLSVVLANVAAIFPSPVVASLATVVLTLIVDLLRRLDHGPTPK